jgi:hypothetical protein
MLARILLSPLVLALFSTLLKAQTVALSNTTCLKDKKTLGTMKNVTGDLVLAKHYIVVTEKNGETSKIVPCNLPIIKTTKKAIKIRFSGFTKEGNIAVKAFGADIVLTKLEIVVRIKKPKTPKHKKEKP